ncbi:MAG TPA: potassium channel protein [Bacteroidia bacterium]|nr:potassium channel protein [Bacteroidia bacterium]
MAITVVGVFGYHFICNYPYVDAFYMTISTVATVGFGEVHPLNSAGRIFTAFLIIISFGTFAYAISSITRFVLDGEFNQLFKTRKLNAAIQKLNNHVIICGYGRNGRQAAQVLKKHKQRFVVIEKSLELTNSMQHDYSDLVITGDATLDETLLKSGILRAKALITSLPIDADNLFIVLTARNLNPKLTIISRASEDNSDTKLKIAGANNVIMPDKVGGAHMASLVMKPDVVEFVDYIVGQGGDSINLEEITFENVPEHLRNHTLKDLEIRNKSGANIIGFKTAAGEYIINPSADTKIIHDAKIFVLGTSDQIARLKELLA